MKICRVCNENKDIEHFYHNRLTCKTCNSDANRRRYEANKSRYLAVNRLWALSNKEKTAEIKKSWKERNYSNTIYNNARRRAAKVRATPPWFEKEEVANVYKKSVEFGFEVDHVVPLKSRYVCGLHCWANLQLLDSETNKQKSNREWPDMPIPENLEMISPKVSNKI